MARKNNEKLQEANARILLGRVIASIERKQFDQAREQILKGIGMHEENKIKPQYAIGVLYLGQLYLNAGEKEKAIDNLKQAEAMFREMGMDYWLGKAQEVMATL